MISYGHVIQLLITLFIDGSERKVVVYYSKFNKIAPAKYRFTDDICYAKRFEYRTEATRFIAINFKDTNFSKHSVVKFTL